MFILQKKFILFSTEFLQLLHYNVYNFSCFKNVFSNFWNQTISNLVIYFYPTFYTFIAPKISLVFKIFNVINSLSFPVFVAVPFQLCSHLILISIRNLFQHNLIQFSIKFSSL